MSLPRYKRNDDNYFTIILCYYYDAAIVCSHSQCPQNHDFIAIQCIV